MPFSQSSQLSAIVGYFENRQPKSVLDVGAGMGQYGFILRNNLELASLFVIEGNVGRQAEKDEWQVRIDGIEGCETYKTPVHDYAYNSMRWGNALQILETIPDHQYEAVLAIDILEHLDKSDGQIFLEHLKRISSSFSLISTPKIFCEQHVEANPYEDHRSVWSDSELSAAGYSELLPNEESWVAIFQKS